MLNQLPSFFKLESRQEVLDIHLHFEINHSIFDSMQRALLNVNPDLLEKLLPSRVSYRRRKRHPFHGIDKGILDEEYQGLALKKCLECNYANPFLILGPFGTGKTKLLVDAAINLVNSKEHNNRVLVCNHLNRGADYFCEHYCNEYANQKPPVPPFRVIPNLDDKNVNVPKSTRKIIPINLNGKERLVVSTFRTVSSIQQQGVSGQFTHILIDEGAQSTEPEVLCALMLARRNTKIIIAGDNHQVQQATHGQ